MAEPPNETPTGSGSSIRRGQPHSSTMRWWLAVLAGVAVTLPVAWLLSFAGTLPFFLGVFFFALFGLLIGAVIYRVAAP